MADESTVDVVYQPPTVTELGSLRELTLQKVNKIGHSHDFHTNTIPNLVGTIVPV